MAKGRRRWVRNTTKIRDEFAAGISHAAIDLILSHMAFREIDVPVWFDKARRRVWFVPDQTTWYTHPVSWYRLAIGARVIDAKIYNGLVEWLRETNIIQAPRDPTQREKVLKAIQGAHKFNKGVRCGTVTINDDGFIQGYKAPNLQEPLQESLQYLHPIRE